MYPLFTSDRCGRDSMDLQLPVQSIPITTYVVSSNPTHVYVYSIQHYVIVICVRSMVFFFVLRFPLTIKLTTKI